MRPLAVIIGLSMAAASMPALAAPDARFLTEAMKGDNAEVAMGRMAIAKGQSTKVKDFGRMLVADHGAHKDKLVKLGSSMRVAATDDLMPDAAKARDMLGGMNGAAFDAAFKKHMVEDHKKDIAKYEAQARSGQSAGVRNLARQTVPTLRKHLATAQGL